MPPSPVLSVEADQSPCGKHGCKETRPADWSAMRAPRRTCSFTTEVWTFLQNDQVRVVTRSLSRLEVARGPSALLRLSQDAHSTPKPPRSCAAVLSFRPSPGTHRKVGSRQREAPDPLGSVGTTTRAPEGSTPIPTEGTTDNPQGVLPKLPRGSGARVARRNFAW